MPDNPVPEQAQPAPLASQSEHQVPISRLNEVLAKNQKLQEALDKAEGERKQAIDDQLAQKEQWRELAEKRGAELAEAQGKVAKLSDYEKTLEKLLSAEVEQIPESKRGLVPDEMTTFQKLNWIAKNKALLIAPQPFDIGAGKQGGGESSINNLTAEELEIARKFGVKPEDYAKNKFK